MPRKPMQPCRVHPWVLVDASTPCPGCAEQADMPSLKQERPDRRPSASDRGYDYKWRKIRDDYAKDHPWCENPYRFHWEHVPMYIVDHKIPKRQGGTDDDSNLQSLCQACHNHKTANDGSRGAGKSLDKGAPNRRG